MAIRKKIYLGFIIIGSILFLSGVIAIVEFNRMTRMVSRLMTANINSINTSRKIMELTDEYNFILLTGVLTDSVFNSKIILNDDRFNQYLAGIKDNFSGEDQIVVVDSLTICYAQYLSVIRGADRIMEEDISSRVVWYNNEFKPVYDNLRKYKKKMGQLTQSAMTENIEQLHDGYYRSIMPGFIAVAAGIILVILFYYFINIYFISPLLKISKGIYSYRENRKSYVVEFDNDDEIQELNFEVKSIIDENKRLKSKTE